MKVVRYVDRPDLRARRYEELTKPTFPEYMNQNEQAQLVGTTPTQFLIRNMRVEKGALFDKSAVLGRLRVAVLGGKIDNIYDVLAELDRDESGDRG